MEKIKTNSREECLELRKHYIGGSDAAAVVGMNTFSSPYALWAEKTGRVPGFEGNLATEVGTYLEEFVAQKFEDETGKKVRRDNQSIVNDKYPWAIANIDRIVVGEDAGLEIKTTSELNTRRFKNGEYPANYYVQCVHYLAVTGKKKWYLAVLIGNRDFRTFEIERDESEIEALMKAEEEFWKHVVDDTPPEADGSAATTETINEIYPTSEPDTEIDLPAFETQLDEYVALKGQIKALEARQDEIANNIKAYMKDAEKGATARHTVSWTSAERKTFDSKKFAAANPSLNLTAYYKTSTYRTFKVQERKA